MSKSDQQNEEIEHDSSSDDEDIDIEEKVQLTDTVIMFPHKKLTAHRKVVAGEICGIFGKRPCVIKFDPDQIVKETEALVNIGGHSNIVCLIDHGTYYDEIMNTSYIILEKYHESNLEDYVLSQTAEPIFDINRGLKFCEQILNGMKFVHEKLIIHKDLKPSNILLCHDLENIRIADFGSSQQVKSPYSMVRCPCTFGTLGYRPPESLDRSYVSLKSDMFSLGVVFYFILSKGKSPFGPESDRWDNKAQTGVIDISSLLVPNPLATKHLIKSMLSMERRSRPSIDKVAFHPCWKMEDCHPNFDYDFEEEELDEDISEKVGKMQLEDDYFGDALERTMRYIDRMKLERQSIKVAPYQDSNAISENDENLPVSPRRHSVKSDKTQLLPPDRDPIQSRSLDENLPVAPRRHSLKSDKMQLFPRDRDPTQSQSIDTASFRKPEGVSLVPRQPPTIHLPLNSRRPHSQSAKVPPLKLAMKSAEETIDGPFAEELHVNYCLMDRLDDSLSSLIQTPVGMSLV